MSIPLGNQHLSLFGIRPLTAQDLTADQRNIFQRPITVAAEGVTEVADSKSAGGMTGESSSEWLRKTESYRSSANAGQQPEAQPEPEPAAQATTDNPQPAQDPESTAPEPAPQPESQPAAQQPPVAATPPRRGVLAGLFGR